MASILRNDLVLFLFNDAVRELAFDATDSQVWQYRNRFASNWKVQNGAVLVSTQIEEFLATGVDNYLSQSFDGANVLV